MYRKNPAIKAQEPWHSLLNNGNRFVLVDGNNKVYAAAHDRYKLEHQQRLRPTLSLRIELTVSFLN